MADWALTRSTMIYPTTVGTNCPLVPEDTNGLESIPAIYAQAYQGGNSTRYVVLKNKGSNAVPVQVTQDGSPLTNQFVKTFVTGSDPSLINTSPQSSPVQIQTNGVSNPFILPEYSVVRLEWTVSNVPPPVVRMVCPTAIPTLEWVGLTNVVYDVQAMSDLASSWSTLGKISSALTNFTFTNPVPASMQFYRLSVP